MTSQELEHAEGRGKNGRKLSNKSKSKALSKAKAPGIPGVHYSKRDWKELEANNKIHRHTLSK